MAAKYTLFMTPEESERVKKTVQDQNRKCQEQMGQLRGPCDPTTLTQQAVSTSLVQDLASAASANGASKNSSETMVAYGVGRPYSPCTSELSALKFMELRDLRMETHHRGRVLYLRRISPVVELKASSWIVVRGESHDDAERLEVFLHKSKHSQELLNLGSEFLVKEPYFTLNHQGQPTIRIDHPSDLIISTYSDSAESWRNANSSSAGPAKTASRCKEDGNAALSAQKYWRAHAHYTEGLSLILKGDESNKTLLNDLYRNRSHINLLLERFDEARTDGLSSLTHGDSREQKALDAKAYYRAGSAAYNLGDFEAAKSYFAEQEKLEPDNQYAKVSLQRTNMRLKEQSIGAYNWKKVVNSLSKTRGRPDVASFDDYTEIRESPGAGRGLFLTRDINADEIIMCEKAFCVVWNHEPDALSSLTCDLRDDAAIRVFPSGLHKGVMQKLLNNPSHIEKVLDLFGDYKGLGNKVHESDGSPVIDTFQVHDIIQRNAFGPGQQSEDEDISNASTGLWIRSAYINHSCVPNAKKEYVGDLMVLRASRRIAAGEEITHSYDESTDYDVRTAALDRTWGFKCHCALCAAEEMDGPALRKRRQGLENEVNAFVQRENASGARKILVLKAKRLRQSLIDTYDPERYEGLPRRALLGIEQWLQAARSK